MSEVRNRAIDKMADLYFARWSSGVEPESYESVRNDGLEFAKQVLREVLELAVVDRNAALPENWCPYRSRAWHERRVAMETMSKEDWVKEIKE